MPITQTLKDFSLSTLSAGFVAVLVGFTSSIAIVFQAAQNLHATPEMMASWMWALGIGMGLSSLIPSLWLKKPVMIAWSTPGAAVLATAGASGNFTIHEATGAFLVCAVLITLVGWTGWFERLMHRIPQSLASALLAGVLARFGLAGFAAAQTATGLVLTMLAAYVLGKRWKPRYAVPLTLAVAIVFVAARALLTGAGLGLDVEWSITTPVFVPPDFTFAAFASLALPLFIVTMASQNVPGVATLQACGYGDVPVSKILTLTGLATLVLAPFGCFALNFGAITAAICMGPQAHTDPARRYTAAVACGGIYIVIGLLGATVTALCVAFPQELVAAIAGLALLGTIANALHSALAHEPEREAALMTFLITMSGVVLAGVGSAFWGIVAGAGVLWVGKWDKSATKR